MPDMPLSEWDNTLATSLTSAFLGAKSALYLASDLSSFTTGTALLADGGVSINRT